MFGVPVLAGSAGVICIGAVAVGPAVVECEAVAVLVDRFGWFCGGIVAAVPGLGTGDGSEALFVGVRHVGIEICPRFFCCRAGPPFLEGIGEDTAVFEVGGDGADGLEIADGIMWSGKVLSFANLIEEVFKWLFWAPWGVHGGFIEGEIIWSDVAIGVVEMLQEIKEFQVGIAFIGVFKDLIVRFINGLHALMEEFLVSQRVDLPLGEVVAILLEEALDLGSRGTGGNDRSCSWMGWVDPGNSSEGWESIVDG